MRGEITSTLVVEPHDTRTSGRFQSKMHMAFPRCIFVSVGDKRHKPTQQLSNLTKQFIQGTANTWVARTCFFLAPTP